tara:strand:+ start:1543 stop:1884 length:342 start_codon:yes stop_codon:yes gene_type:complete
MPFSRLAGRRIFKNQNLLYDEKFKSKDLKKINQYNTATISYPSVEQTQEITYDTRIWKLGDRLYNLAYEVYGDSRYWWVIAQFNKKPTDHHFKVGDTYYIPLDLEDILDTYGY